MLDLSEVVHVTTAHALAPGVGVVAKMSLTLDSGKLAGDVAEIILRSLEGDGIEVLKRRQKMFRCIASVRSHAAKLKLFGQVAGARIHGNVRLNFRDVRVLIKRWV